MKRGKERGDLCCLGSSWPLDFVFFAELLGAFVYMFGIYLVGLVCKLSSYAFPYLWHFATPVDFDWTFEDLSK